jgi:hypothetical protein
MEFRLPESLLWLTNEIDITNGDPNSIQILSKDFFTGPIPILPVPDECHQGDFPGFAFLVRSFGKVGNGGQITGSIGANDPGGLFRLGKDVFMADGSFIGGDSVQLGLGTSVFNVLADDLVTVDSTIRGTRGLPLLPFDTGFCPIPDFTCGGPDVIVPPGGSLGPLAAGSYGKIVVLGGGTLVLGPGAFEACSFRTGKSATIQVTGPTQSEIDVTGSFRISDGSTMTRDDIGTPLPVVNVAGRIVRVSASSTLQAFVHAPNAQITFGRSALLAGSFCADTSRSDKHVTLVCPYEP